MLYRVVWDSSIGRVWSDWVSWEDALDMVRRLPRVVRVDGLRGFAGDWAYVYLSGKEVLSHILSHSDLLY